MASRRSKSTVFNDTPAAARETACALLARRDHTTHELSQKLKKRGFSETAVSAALSSLKGLRLLDDARFARRWVRCRMESDGFGPHRLKWELREKGIPPETISTVLHDAWEGVDPVSAAERALRRRYKDLARLGTQRACRRAAAYLARKGHSAEVIRALFRKLKISKE